jgi:hypothetical protein
LQSSPHRKASWPGGKRGLPFALKLTLRPANCGGLRGVAVVPCIILKLIDFPECPERGPQADAGFCGVFGLSPMRKPAK